MFTRLFTVACIVFAASVPAGAAESSGTTNANASTLRLATFDIDATPPIGSWMAYDP
jgi:hypothetical protein